MSSGPANATLNGDGFRFYRWTEPGGEEFDLLSVTSIRKLCGENYGLVNWKLNNLIDTVMGSVKRPKPGKRVAVLKGQFHYPIEEYPSEFVTMYLDAGGPDAPNTEQAKQLRAWLRDTADEPRNIAARRGTIVHAAIEKNIAWDRIERPWVETEFLRLSKKDRDAAKAGVTDADVTFIRDAVHQYFDMRASVPFVIIAREPQVFNLTMGYGGSADTIIWFLPEGTDIRSVPPARRITLDDIESIGGTLAVGDWKTSSGVYTDHVVQVHAYGAGEFVGQDGLRDSRLTDILHATSKGVIVHVRPEGWGVYKFPFTEEVFNGFAGSVAFARLLAKYPRATALFEENLHGGADLTEGEGE